VFKQIFKYRKEGGIDFSYSRLTLAFIDPALEKRFKSSYFKSNLQLGRACHVIAIFFFSLVGIWNAVFINPSNAFVWSLVVLFVAIIFLIGLISSYSFQKYYARYWQQLFAFYVLVTGAGFTIVTITSDPGYPIDNFVGIIFCLFFCYTFIRLTFLWATLAGNAIVLIYIVSTVIFLGPYFELFAVAFFYMFGINLLGMMVCYALELISRRDFILNTLLEKEENKTRNINIRLEQMVRDRTRELEISISQEKKLVSKLEREEKVLQESLNSLMQMEGQLIQAQKMESIGRLAGGVAHDYNNISSIIIGYTELSMDTVGPDDPIYPNLEAVFNAANRASDITKQLLAFARKQAIAPQVIDLNKTVDSMLNILRRIIGEDIDLVFLPGKETWQINIDPSQIDQILANLCVNARDAIPDVGNVTIETNNTTFNENYCSDHAGATPGEYTLLVVSDNGMGMAPEILDNIFEPFFTTKEVGQGTGLGLSTVYGIVKQNNGFINVYSEPGTGTTTRIYLPRHEGSQVDDCVESFGAISQGQGETVLLVEDDKPILELGKKMLQNLGYSVLVANSPLEAVVLVKEHKKKIHLLITDVIMPKMNGHELASKLKIEYPDLKVLFMSGYTANVISHHGVLEEGINFISKPFSKKDLAIKIREVLNTNINSTV
jgi:signal transduction histidine kinase/CheY-like chemotaxis protein